MRNFLILSDALACIEENLENPFCAEDVANACHCSLSCLQKLFRYALGMGIMEYQSRRRLTQAAKDLKESAVRVVDIAYKYQYGSHEAFARAFAKMWGSNPSTYRREWKTAGLYPRIVMLTPDRDIEGRIIMHRQMDISELYDALKTMAGTYVLCFDIMNLMQINHVSHDAGDVVIRECFKRIDEAATEEMLLFRIGGDEFALMTGFEDREKAMALAKDIVARNAQTVAWSDKHLPAAMRVGGFRIRRDGLRYAELYQDIMDAIHLSKSKEEGLFIAE